MSEQIQVNTFENLKDVKALAHWVAEKNDEVQRYIKASDGKWDDDRIAILDSRTKEIEAAQARLTQLQRVEDVYNKTVERKKDLSEPVVPVPFENGDGERTVTVSGGATKSLEEALSSNHSIKSIGSWEDVAGPYRINLPDVFPSFGNDNLAVKTVMTRAAGYAPANDRTSKLVPYPQREPRVADLIPVTQTNLGTINYMEETTALAGTNAQVSIAEGNAKFENALAFTARAAPVETVGTWLPVTTQQLDDVAGIQGIIENRMSLFLQLKEEDLLLNGTGTTPQLIGFQGAAASAVLTQARGTDTNLDAIYKAMQQIRVTGLAEPDGIVMHPDNFTPINLYKSTTGEYSFDVTAQQGILRLFGKPLILSPVATSGTALVGSFRSFSEIWRRMGMTVMVGLNSDDFTKNKRTILAEFREALTIYRQTAFCKVTGLQ